MPWLMVDFPAGILLVGGDVDNLSAPLSVEFWSKQGSCVLPDYPRQMRLSPSVNLVADQLVTCYKFTCEIYQEGSWQHLQNITGREEHSSATTKDSVLLIGGLVLDGANVAPTNTTEWIPLDGSPPHPGPFNVRHGGFHCTIQISPDVVVVTGGCWDLQSHDGCSEDYVTEYQLIDGKETLLTPLVRSRYAHACGVYQDGGGQQVRHCSWKHSVSFV